MPPELAARMRFAPDPYAHAHERWLAALPPHTRWDELEDQLVDRGWFPKNALTRLRVYGCEGGHEVVIEPASRSVLFRIARHVAQEARGEIAATLAAVLASAARL